MKFLSLLEFKIWTLLKLNKNSFEYINVTFDLYALYENIMLTNNCYYYSNTHTITIFLFSWNYNQNNSSSSDYNPPYVHMQNRFYVRLCSYLSTYYDDYDDIWAYDIQTHT